MKRGLRSAASANDAKNGPLEKSPKPTLSNSRSQGSRKDASLKENKENATRKGTRIVRKDVVKPLQEKNSVALTRTAEPKTPTIVDVPIKAVSKPRNRRKSVGDQKTTEEKIVTEPDDITAIKHHPPEIFVDVSTVTIRRTKQPKSVQQPHGPEKDAKRQFNGEKSSVQEMLAIENPTQNTRRNIDEQKPVEKGTTSKHLVPFAIKTRSATKHSGEPNVNPVRGTRSRKNQPTTKVTPTKKPTVVSAITTTSEETNNKAKTSYVSNVEVYEKREKVSSKPKTNAEPKSTTKSDADRTPFVTTRRNRKEQMKPPAANDDKPQLKDAIVSNVTTRRDRANSQAVSEDKSKGVPSNITTRRANSQAVSEDKSKGVPSNITTRHANSQSVSEDKSKDVDTVSGISRSKRSKSVHRVITTENKMDPKAKVDAIVSPPKRRKIAQIENPKVVGRTTKQQQPELLVNRSTASDSSDQSNVSAVPIYKRIGNTNNNTVNSVFDFELNSQENTLNNDEETNELIAKMIREKRASIAKPKGNRKNGVTKAKSKVTRSKQIEQLHAKLKKLHELKMHSKNHEPANVPIVRERRISPKPQIKSQKRVFVVNLVDEENVSVAVSSKKSQPTDKVMSNEPKSIPVNDMMDDLQFHIGHWDVEDNASIRMPPSPLMLSTTSTETPPRQAHSAYTGPRKENALHQSTPVQIINSGNASPWRLDSDGIQHPTNVFSRYSECEKSPIKSGKVTEVAAVVKSPTKTIRPFSVKQPISHNLPEAEKPKALADDIRNGFGFIDDDDTDSDTNDTQRPLLPDLKLSPFAPQRKFLSPKKPTKLATSPKKSTKESKETTSSKYFKVPLFNRIREKVQLWKSTLTPVSSSMQQSKTQSILTHFGDASKPSSSRGTKITVKKTTCEKKRLRDPGETETTASYADKDGVSLFDTTWLTSDDKPHRSYSRVTKREPKRQNDYKSSILIDDDESECGESVVQKRIKRTKTKDDKHEKELRQFEANMNSDFMDVDKYEMILERSVSSSNLM